MDDVLDVAHLVVRMLVRPIRRPLSSVKVRDGKVTVRNFPWWRRSFALDQVSHFDWQRTENVSVAVLLLVNGDAVAVHALSDKRPGTVTVLNDTMRDNAGSPVTRSARSTARH